MSTSLSTQFIRSSVLYAIAGMALGIQMAASHDHGQMPTHAHLMLFGWVGMSIYAVFYRLWPDAGNGSVAKIHAVLAHVGLIGITVGLFMIYGGNIAVGEPIASVSALILLINMVLFGWIVWCGTRNN